jgi:hypothetical protein
LGGDGLSYPAADPTAVDDDNNDDGLGPEDAGGSFRAVAAVDMAL